MQAILNVCSAPPAELRKLGGGLEQVEVLDRGELSAGKILRTLSGMRRRRLDSLSLYCRDIEHQHNLFLLKLVGALSGAREVRFTDPTGRRRRLSPSLFLLKDVPRFMVSALQAGFAFMTFGLVAGILFVLTRHPRRRGIAPGALKSMCYLKTDFWFGLSAGGSVTHTREFIGAAAESGWRVGAFAPDGLDAYRLSARVSVIQPSHRLFDFPQAVSQVEYNLRFALRALPAIRAARPAFLYQRASQNNFSGVLLARLAGVPFVLEYNSSARWAGLSRRRARGSFIENLVDRINLDGADLIAVVSAELASRLVRAGVKRERIVVNPNGVNPARFSDAVEPARIKASFPKNAPIVGFIGIFGQWHGVLTLASAVKHVLKEEPLARFLIVGDGDLKDKMVSILSEDGVLDSVTFGGVVRHEEAPRYLAACDILVSPHEDMADGSRFFGSPTKIFEYMAMGKGIVASRVGQLAEILEHGLNAVLVEQRDPRDLARGILSLIRDPAGRKEMGRKARRTVMEAFTWRHNFERIVKRLTP